MNLDQFNFEYIPKKCYVYQAEVAHRNLKVEDKHLEKMALTFDFYPEFFLVILFVLVGSAKNDVSYWHRTNYYKRMPLECYKDEALAYNFANFKFSEELVKPLMHQFVREFLEQAKDINFRLEPYQHEKELF